MGNIPKPPDLEKTLRRAEEWLKVHTKREALRFGMSVEEYTKVEEEKNIKFISYELGITREEVIAQGWLKKPRFLIAAEAEARKLSVERGEPVTAQDILKQYDERLKNAPSIEEPCMDLLMDKTLLETYKETGDLPNSAELHLQNCKSCKAHFEYERRRYLVFNAQAEPECLTETELHNVHENGKIETARRAHAENCERCKMHLHRHFEMYLDKVLPYLD